MMDRRLAMTMELGIELMITDLFVLVYVKIKMYVILMNEWQKDKDRGWINVWMKWGS